MTDICERCKLPAIPGCENGAVEVPGRELWHKECPNAFQVKIRRVMERLGSDTRDIKAVHSPLAVKDGQRIDRTGDNLLLITNEWASVVGPLKWALGCKGTAFHWKRVTDGDLLDAFFRKEPRPIDLVDESVPLVILRLGMIGHPNKAAANLLHEVLERRFAMGRPTWVVWEKDGSRAWGVSRSEAVENFLLENFETLNFNVDEPVGVDEAAEEYEHGSASLGMTIEDVSESETEEEEEVEMSASAAPLPWEAEAKKKRGFRR